LPKEQAWRTETPRFSSDFYLATKLKSRLGTIIRVYAERDMQGMDHTRQKGKEVLF
jgi:hypothetical protein